MSWCGGQSGQMPFHMVQADLAEFAAAYVARREALFAPERAVFRLRREQELMPEIRMDVDQIQRIFDRFYRCDESRSEKGSGVGLYVVKYIAERHGGRIEAQNEGGLKLVLTFPAAGSE